MHTLKSGDTAECQICNTVEISKHLINKCTYSNAHQTWKLFSVYIKFNAEWENTVVGFYSQNTRKTRDLNFIIYLKEHKKIINTKCIADLKKKGR